MTIKINPVTFAPPLAFLIKALSSTYRYKTEGHYEEILALRNSGRRLVYAFWHDELFPAVYFMRNQGVTVVISQSRDGELIARIIESMGFRTARGSSTRGGANALLGVLRNMEGDTPTVGITMDGPKGPRHKVKDGVIYLAQKTNALVTPGRLYMSRTKVFEKSWDKFQVPLPFATIRVVCGKPYSIPAELSPEEFEQEKIKLENIMESLI